jgi:hypothetical protein
MKISATNDQVAKACLKCSRRTPSNVIARTEFEVKIEYKRFCMNCHKHISGYVTQHT